MTKDNSDDPNAPQLPRLVAWVLEKDGDTRHRPVKAGLILAFAFVLVTVFLPIVGILIGMTRQLVDKGVEELVDLRGYALIYAGIGTAIFAYWRASIAERQARASEGQLEQAEKRTVTENFVKAVELLGAMRTEEDAEGKSKAVPAIEIRLGAIFSLEKIAQESVERYHIPVMETLTAYVREQRSKVAVIEWPGAIYDRLTEAGESVEESEAFRKAIRPLAPETRDLDGFVLDYAKRLKEDRAACLNEWQAAHPPQRLPEDLRAIFDVFERRHENPEQLAKENESERPLIDLSRTNLQRIEYHGDALKGANLSGAQMEGANLRQARMEGANLIGARMEGAEVREASLAGTKMHNAYLGGVDFTDADLSNAQLYRAEITAAILDRSLMSGTKLQFLLVNPRNRPPVSSKAAALRLVDWRATEFDNAEAVQTFFNKCFGDATVVLPDYVDRPAHWLDYQADDEEYLSYWRGVWETLPYAPLWGHTTVTRAWKHVEAKPPKAPINWGSDP